MQLASDSSMGFLGTMKTIASTDEGFGALFQGLKPALLRQASYQGIKMFLYEPIRDAVLAATTPEGEEGSAPSAPCPSSQPTASVEPLCAPMCVGARDPILGTRGGAPSPAAGRGPRSGG